LIDIGFLVFRDWILKHF